MTAVWAGHMGKEMAKAEAVGRRHPSSGKRGVREALHKRHEEQSDRLLAGLGPWLQGLAEAQRPLPSGSTRHFMTLPQAVAPPAEARRFSACANRLNYPRACPSGSESATV